MTCRPRRSTAQPRALLIMLPSVELDVNCQTYHTPYQVVLAVLLDLDTYSSILTGQCRPLRMKGTHITMPFSTSQCTKAF